MKPYFMTVISFDSTDLYFIFVSPFLLVFTSFAELNYLLPHTLRRSSSKTIALRSPIYGPRHSKTYLREDADSEGQDQTARMRSLIRAFAVR